MTRDSLLYKTTCKTFVAVPGLEQKGLYFSKYNLYNKHTMVRVSKIRFRTHALTHLNKLNNLIRIIQILTSVSSSKYDSALRSAAASFKPTERQPEARAVFTIAILAKERYLCRASRPRS